MPYVDSQMRADLDPAIDQVRTALAEAHKKHGDLALLGILNYTMTRLVLSTLEVIGKKSYWVIAAMSGVIDNVGREFYRRYAVPYEEEKIVQNGDVY
jgi:hypothetical protein